MAACESGSAAAVKLLVTRGCDTTRTDNNGRTGWEIALTLNRKECLTVLEALAKDGHADLEAEAPLRVDGSW